MKPFIGMVAVLLLTSMIPASAASVDEQINEAIQPLPEDLRAGATVVVYDGATGERKVLRQGTNSIECEPNHEYEGFIRCYNKVMAPRNELQAKLRAQKKSDKEIQEATAAAVKAGTLKTAPFGSMSYRLATKDGVIKRLWIMSVPFATPESIGVSTTSQREAAMKGHPIPWMMLPGTAGAHIMIPVND